jgi:hypothetical protein
MFIPMEWAFFIAFRGGVEMVVMVGVVFYDSLRTERACINK